MWSLGTASGVLRNVEFNRNVEDASITIAEKKRDYVLWGKQVLLCAGEDKRDPTELAKAKADLENKNKGKYSFPFPFIKG